MARLHITITVACYSKILLDSFESVYIEIIAFSLFVEHLLEIFYVNYFQIEINLGDDYRFHSIFAKNHLIDENSA